MIVFFSSLNASILLIISLLHAYWMLGGQWGFAAALPTDESGKQMLNPKVFDCGMVAIGLMCMSIYVFSISKIINLPLPNVVSKYGIWVVAFIFLARAIGDFKYVGFSKKIKNTRFAELDSRFYTPLCLYLGVTFLILELCKA